SQVYPWSSSSSLSARSRRVASRWLAHMSRGSNRCMSQSTNTPHLSHGPQPDATRAGETRDSGGSGRALRAPVASHPVEEDGPGQGTAEVVALGQVTAPVPQVRQ